jgi:hypothetical protein
VADIRILASTIVEDVVHVISGSNLASGLRHREHVLSKASTNSSPWVAAGEVGPKIPGSHVLAASRVLGKPLDLVG